jgi:hypothetical protein
MTWSGWSGGAALAEVERLDEWLLVTTPYSEAIVQQFRSMPGCVFDRKIKKWVGPDEAMREVLAKIESAKLAIIDDIPKDNSLTLCLPFNPTDLYDYQLEGVDRLSRNLIRRHAALLADDMGLGKSAQAIRTAGAVERWQMMSGSSFRKILILCPAMVVPTWIEQYRRWGNDEPHRLGSRIKKRDGGGRLLEWAGVAVASFDTFRSVWRDLAADVDFLIIDEGHYLSNPKSHRTRAVVRFVEAHNTRPYLLMTTGTPVDARPRGLWQLVDLLYPGRFGSKGAFEARYCGGHMVEIKGLDKPVWEADGATNLEELNRRLRPLMVRRTRGEVLDLPDYQRIVMPVEMPPKAAAALSRAAQLIALDGIGHEQAIGRMLSSIEEHKIDAACELAENLRAQGRKPLLFTLRKATATEIGKRLDIPVVTGEVSSGERLRILTSADAAVATIFSASTGMDGLQHHFDCGVFVGLDWVATTLQQAMARLVRIGQEKNVSFYFLVGLGTIDELVRSKVIERLENFTTIVGDAPDESRLASDLRGGKSDQDLLNELFASL